MNEFEKRINLNFPLEILSQEICKQYNLGKFIEVNDKLPLPGVTALSGSTWFPKTLVLHPIYPTSVL